MPRILPPDCAVHVVMNAGSGGDDKRSSRQTLEEAFAAGGSQAVFHLIDDPKRIGAVIEETRRACRGDGGILVAAGGDGTVNACAAAAAGTDIPFAVVPLGTFNYFARDIGMPLEPAAAAAAILDGVVAPAHVARLNQHLFLVNASIGLYVRLIEEREKHEATLGRNRLVAVASGLVTALRGHYAMTLDMVVDGKPVQVRTPLVFLGKNYLQLRNLELDIAECIAAGEIGVIMLQDANKLTIVGMAWQALLGRLDAANKLHAFCAQTLEIGTRRSPVSAVIDGEIVALQSPLKVEIQRNALQVVRPRPKDAEAEPNSLAAAGGER
ncbi:MAG: diacylglycerol kinase family protein [Reyranellaceae bacterium]